MNFSKTMQIISSILMSLKPKACTVTKFFHVEYELNVRYKGLKNTFYISTQPFIKCQEVQNESDFIPARSSPSGFATPKRVFMLSILNIRHLKG